MKTSKTYPEIDTYYYRPEFDLCLDCGAPLKRSHTAWRKTITSLSGTAKVYNQAYRCQDRELCGQPERVYRSAYADGLTLPYYTYGLDVIVDIGQQRLREHQTIPEIHQSLSQGEAAIAISEREVQYLFDAYLVLSACVHGQRLEGYRAEIEANGGIVLAVDGAKPEKGQPGLYIFRDALSGCRLHSALLHSGDYESIAAELRVVIGLGLPVQAVISDDEPSLVKAIALVLPEKPHGLCHTHFLKAAQKPVYAADQQLAKELKRPLRAINKVEKQLRHQPESLEILSVNQQKAIRGYLDALRAVLLTKGQAPFRLAGTAIYEALDQLTASLRRSLVVQDHLLLAQLHKLAESYEAYQTCYETIHRQQDWFLGLSQLLAVPLTETHHWSTRLGAEVAQEIADYLEALDAVRDVLQEDAAFFSHLQRRVTHWAPGLFWTYDWPALPRTNNDLEADIGDVKEQYRRITGRRSLKDYLMRYGPYLTFDDNQDDPEELLKWFQQVEHQDFLDEKAKLDALREHLRNMRRFRDNPDDFLTHLESLWNDST